MTDQIMTAVNGLLDTTVEWYDDQYDRLWCRACVGGGRIPPDKGATQFQICPDCHGEGRR